MTGRRAGVRAPLLVGVGALASPLPATVRPARGEHAPAFRCTVLGYVTDPGGFYATLFAGTLERFLAQ